MDINYFQPKAIVPSRHAYSTNSITLRSLQSHSDFQEVQHLRQEIDLAIHAKLDSNFLEHEKKEMN